MAFHPTPHSATPTVSDAGLSTTHVFNIPTGNIGDLILLFTCAWKPTTGAFTHVLPLGWYDGANGAYNSGANTQMEFFKHYCDGGDATSLTIEFTAPCYAIGLAFIVPEYDKTPDDTGAYDTLGYTDWTANSTTANPNPPDLSPSDWGGAEDNTWITFLGALDDEATVSSPPSDHTLIDDVVSTLGENAGRTLAATFYQLNAASHNPGAYTLSQSERCWSGTMAIREYQEHTPNGPGYMVRNLDTDTTLYSSDLTTAYDIYSVSKVMTALVVYDNKTEGELASETRVLVSDDVQSGSGSDYVAGDELSLEDMVKAMLMESSNTCSYGLAAQIGAESLGGSPTHAEALAEFHSMMDDYGSALGMTTPVGGWAGPAGFPVSNQVSTQDMMLMLADIAEIPYLVEMMHTPSATIVNETGDDYDIVHSFTNYAGLLDQNSAGDIFGKGGGVSTPSPEGCGAFVWVTPSGQRIAIVTNGYSGAGENRFQDFRHFVRTTREAYPALMSTTTTETGSGTVTAQSSSASGSGAVEVAGEGTVTSDTAAASGAGVVGISGTGAVTAELSVISGSGVIESAGTGAVSAGSSTASGSGELVQAGTGAVQCQAASAAGLGEIAHSGSAAVSAQQPSAAGLGALVYLGAGGGAADDSTAAGAGSTGTGATGAVEAGSSSVNGAGLVEHPGAGAPESAPGDASGSGTVEHTASGDAVANVSTASGSGVVGDVVGGAGTAAAQAATANGAGSIIYSAAGAVIPGPCNASGEASLAYIGIGAVLPHQPMVSGTGANDDADSSGDGDCVAQQSQVAGVGAVVQVGTAHVAANDADVAGFGQLQHIGAGVCQAQVAEVVGLDSYQSATLIYGIPKERRLFGVGKEARMFGVKKRGST